MAQKVESLPPIWETQIEFLAAGLSLAQSQPCGHLENRPLDGQSLACLPPFKEIKMNKKDSLIIYATYLYLAQKTK